jgi:hypothetical protein
VPCPGMPPLCLPPDRTHGDPPLTAVQRSQHSPCNA